MAQILLGIVDTVGTGKARPAARLRPLFQLSSDKTSWLEVSDEEFPNSGVVSWWTAPHDAPIGGAWLFHIEESRTYEPANPHHDLYGVKGTPVPAIELIDLPEAVDPEDIRILLVEEGIPVGRCLTKRCAFRDSAGSIVGPFELSIRDNRLFLDERDVLVAVSQAGSAAEFAEWEGHMFPPPENWLHRSGEVDYSSNAVFLKRILREMREASPQLFETAKVTERMIVAYSAAFEKMILTPLQTQRIRRLRTLANRGADGIALSRDSVSDLLSIASIKEQIDSATAKAVREALDNTGNELGELKRLRDTVLEDVTRLRAEAEQEEKKIQTLRNEESALLANFDSHVHQKFEDIREDASSFLADIAVVRAALSAPSTLPECNRGTLTSTGREHLLDVDQVLDTLCRHFRGAGLGNILPAMLLSAWASGYIPVAFGVFARDIFSAAHSSLFGKNAYFTSLGPTFTTPTDLAALPAISATSVRTVSEVIKESAQTDQMRLLVLDNINLCQIDSVLMPILRSYVNYHATDDPQLGNYPTALGMWPSNLLLAGILIDSPLTLPLSPELWSCSLYLDATRTRTDSRESVKEVAETVFHLSQGIWAEWKSGLNSGTTSDTRVLAAHAGREIARDSLSKRMLQRFSASIDRTAPSITEAQRAGLFCEMMVVPYLISRGVPPESWIESAPADASIEDGFISKMTALFLKWGVPITSERELES